MQYDYDYDDNDEKLESFPCEECGEVLTTLDDFGKHLTDTHDGKVKPKQCVVSNCDAKMDSVETLIHHIGVKHYSVVKQRVSKIEKLSPIIWMGPIAPGKLSFLVSQAAVIFFFLIEVP